MKNSALNLKYSVEQSTLYFSPLQYFLFLSVLKQYSLVVLKSVIGTALKLYDSNTFQYKLWHCIKFGFDSRVVCILQSWKQNWCYILKLYYLCSFQVSSSTYVNGLAYPDMKWNRISSVECIHLLKVVRKWNVYCL